MQFGKMMRLDSDPTHPYQTQKLSMWTQSLTISLFFMLAFLPVGNKHLAILQ